MAIQTYVVSNFALQIIDHWQTLLTGVLAVVAAGVTIFFTLRAAKWEVDAANAQIRVTIDLYRARSKGERTAFLTMLAAAMETVVDDVSAARLIIGPAPGPGASMEGYIARHRIKKTAFADIRAVLVRIADGSTSAFLKLDNAIDDFSSQWQEFQGTSGNKLLKGFHYGIVDQITHIEAQALELLQYAKAELSKLQGP